MYIKRVNIIISWILILIVMTHICATGYIFVFLDYNIMLIKGTAHLTATVFSIHVLLCIIIMLFFHKGSDFSINVMTNKRVIVQRVTAILMVLVVHRHVLDLQFSGMPYSTWHKALIIISEFVFYASVVTHITSSVSPSLVGYGLIDSKEKIKKVDKIVFAVCGTLACITFIAITKYVVLYNGYY